MHEGEAKATQKQFRIDYKFGYNFCYQIIPSERLSVLKTRNVHVNLVLVYYCTFFSSSF